MKLITSFNELLALIMLAVVIPGLWILDGRGVVTFSPNVIGATIPVWTAIAYFFFRKAKRKGGDD